MKVTITPPPKPSATVTITLTETEASLLRRALESVSHSFDSGYMLADLLRSLRGANV